MALALALALTKPLSVLLVAILLLVPCRRFADRGRYLWYLAVALVPAVLATGLWSWLVRDRFAPLDPTRADPWVQLGFILNGPRRFATIMLNTAIASSGEWATSFVGILGWLDTALPDWLVRAYLIALVLGAVTSERNVAGPRLWQRGLTLAIWFAFVTAVLAASFVTWTPAGIPQIGGIQGRYFIAVAPLLYLASYHPALQWRSPAWRLAWPIGVTLASGVTVWALLSRYWL